MLRLCTVRVAAHPLPPMLPSHSLSAVGRREKAPASASEVEKLHRNRNSWGSRRDIEGCDLERDVATGGGCDVRGRDGSGNAFRNVCLAGLGLIPPLSLPSSCDPSKPEILGSRSLTVSTILSSVYSWTWRALSSAQTCQPSLDAICPSLGRASPDQTNSIAS